VQNHSRWASRCVCSTLRAAVWAPLGSTPSLAADAQEISVGAANGQSKPLRVEEGGGGGGQNCTPGPKETCATVTVSSGDVSLAGQQQVPYSSSSPFDIAMVASLIVPFPGGINPTPAGEVVPRFTAGTIQISVHDGYARFSLTLTGPFDRTSTFAITGSGPVVQSQSAPCIATSTAGGATTIRTSLTTQLAHLGRTTITITYVAACGV
jgi:hypothetical protein